MKKLLIAASLVTFLSVPAFAGAKCDVPEAEWQSKETLQKKLEAEGWKVKNIKTSNGCYEVYGKDAKGNRKETFFDPKTFADMGEDD
jgi:hypothetical protein